ncbi:signal peptidase I [bacterium]|nr:signal peptidase I [bacterium]
MVDRASWIVHPERIRLRLRAPAFAKASAGKPSTTQDSALRTQDSGLLASSPAVTEAPPAPPKPAFSLMTVLREWCDALVITILLAMFIRTFLVELYKIPSGSMSPTLVGGQVVETDYNRDGRADLLMLGDGSALLFVNDGSRLVAHGRVTIAPEERARYESAGAIVERDDRILVNKFAYWWRAPRRGELVVFKVPGRIWSPDRPIYIKRCVGLPGEHIGLAADGRLEIDGKRVEEPLFFRAQHYSAAPGLQDKAVENNQIYVFGDNTLNSYDSRYWGGVPLNHLRGRPFFRYFPLGKMMFLNSD